MLFSFPFLIISFASSFAIANDTPVMRDYRAKVLAKRVRHVLEYRLAALEGCAPSESAGSVASLVAKMRAAVVRKSESDSDSDSEPDALRLLELFQKSDSLAATGVCQREIARWDRKLWKSERRKFLAFRFTALAPLVRELDPHCAPLSEVLPDRSDGALEINPCFAGDGIVFQALTRGPFSSYDELRGFVVAFHHAVEAAASGGTVDYLDLYGLGDNHLFWAMMAFFMASSSSNSGYVDGFGEYVWRQGLRHGHAPREVLDGYHRYKQYMDLFRDVLAWARQKHLRLRIAGRIDVAGASHHDFMAAFLSCHYRMTGRSHLARLVPEALGVAYESLDFASHLKQGASLKDSIDDFREDTARYSRGVGWASAACVPST